MGIDSIALHSDLFDLYSALRHKEATETYLPLFVKNGRIYYVWHWNSLIVFGFAILAEKFTGKCPLDRNVIDALLGLMQKVNQYVEANYHIYQKQYVDEHRQFVMQKIMKSSDKEKLYDDELDPVQFSKARHAIMDCYEKTSQVWRLFFPKQYLSENERTKEEDRVRKLLQYFIPVDKLPDYLRNKNHYNALKRAECLLHIEAVTEQSIPFVILAKLCKSETLSSVEVTHLKDWIAKLNEKIEELSIKKFMRALEEIVNILPLKDSFSISLEKLAYELEKAGCQLFMQDDKEHIQWRSGLNKGSKIQCNDKIYTLKSSIRSDEKDARYRFFPVEENDEEWVMISRNPLEFLFIKFKFEKAAKQIGISLIEIVDVDRKGKCLIMKKLISFLDKHPFKSQTPCLDANDERPALVIASHLGWWRKYSQAVDNLELSHLGFDAEGCLRAIVCMPIRPLAYDQEFPHEKFIKKLAKVNPYVANFVLHVSKPCFEVDIKQERLTNFYREAIQEIIETGKWEKTSRNPNYNSYREEHNKPLNELCKTVKDFKENCFKEVIFYLQKIQEYDYKEEEKVKNYLSNQLSSLYKASPLSLWQEQEESFRKKLLIIFLKPFLVKLEKLYEQDAATYNPSDLKQWESILQIIRKEEIASERNAHYYEQYHRKLEAYNQEAQKEQMQK